LAQVLRVHAEVEVPVEAVFDPALVPRFVAQLAGLEHRGRLDEELNLHLLELARAEDEVAGGDLVAERLADLRDAERQLAPRRLQHVVEVDEDALRRLRTQVRDRRVLLHGPHEGLEHEVELARRRELALAALRAERAADAAVLARLA